YTTNGGLSPRVVRGAVCGDGFSGPGEFCEDGNRANGDGCEVTCTPTGCGDNVVGPGEQCDDGNIVAGDCCSPGCQPETAGSSCADDGNVCTDDQCDGTGFCVHPPNTVGCNDGDLCTFDDTCSGGTCAGTAAPRTGCRGAFVPGKSSILFRSGDRLTWKW